MKSVGPGELRRDAAELVRRVEAGEDIEITVSGRPAARLLPVAQQQWQSWDDIASVFTGRPDPTWHRDRDLVDGPVTPAAAPATPAPRP